MELLTIQFISLLQLIFANIGMGEVIRSEKT